MTRAARAHGAFDRRLVGAHLPPLAVALGLPGLVSLLALLDVPAGLPAVLYLVAVALAVLVEGTAFGLVAAAASAVAFGFLFVSPRDAATFPDLGNGAELVGFAAAALALTALLAQQERLREREREARRLAEEAAARTQRLEAVARALARTRTPQQVLDAVLAEGLAGTDARAGLIGLLRPDGRTIEVVASRGYEGRDHTTGYWSHFGVDEELPLSQTVRTGEPVYLASTAERDRRFPLLIEVGGPAAPSHALTCLPLTFENRILGGLVLSFPTEQEFDAERRELKIALAAQAAQALDRARLDAAERRLRERLALLAEASELLGSSLDYQQTLRRLADFVVPRLADWCAVDMVAEDGSVERLAVAHQDPGKVRHALDLAKRFPSGRDADRGVHRVLRTGEPELTPEITDELLVEVAGGDPRLLRILHELGLRSALIVPLVARGKTLGALTLVAAETVEPYTPAELELAQDLARRAAAAVDNARLHEQAERRADAARALQHVADAVVLVDRSGSVRYANDAATRLLGPELEAWPHVRGRLAERLDEGPELTLPIDVGGEERWLQRSRTDLEGGSVHVLRDVTEERLLERTRSELVATASHELRTPIAAVYGAFQTLLRDDVPLDADQRRQFLEMGLDESARLTAIVDDLLLVGQLEAGTPRIRRERCDLPALIDSVVRVHTDDSHAMVTALEPGLSAVECDPLRLRQVLSNLLENAVKYSPDGGTVTVSAQQSDGVVGIEVADEGIGIPPRDHARIFERFVRLDPALSRGVGGTGLGLYISRELVRRMGGGLSVRSQEGVGTTFRIELPAH